ncbi:hypothetical protein OK015_15980 [Mycobacterium sp. Aquia_216]|uniref:hypothetical protein n=1 Tax=Mycobacterium sp. Aquia_216 TaxID=2991729 RepID=UPI00227C4ECD|nr:hypothetical protein [Mycobacterium sp. Aquia_216]WAJ42765.1 hypothetical protein OK015_15980 [Mycobacterium sp. Aquia_216]
MNTTPRRQPRTMHVLFAGVVGIATLAFVHAAHPDAAAAMFGQVRLTAIDSPAPQAPANLGGGSFAADAGDDEAQLQQQLAQQEMLQAEQQNEAAQQQALQDELQGQQTEQQANNP